MAGYKQRERILAFTSPLGPDTLLAERFSGTEAISQLFDYTADVLAEAGTVVDPTMLIGKRVTMAMIVNDAGDRRYFNGIVASFESTGGDTLFHSYRLRMVPALWLLSLNTQTRVFQDKTVLEIVRAVLAPYSILITTVAREAYQSLEYCTQYRETDLRFVERLMQDHGLFYYFTHSDSDHTLVLTDSVDASRECPIKSEFRFRTTEENSINLYDPRIHSFSSRSTLIPGEQTYWDYRFIPYAVSHATPQTSHSTCPTGDNAHEHYDFSDSAAAVMKTPSADSKVPLLQTLFQQVAKERTEAGAIVCEGTSTAWTMQAGSTFRLSDFPQTDKNGKYLLTEVLHDVTQRPGYRSRPEELNAHPYANRFRANPIKQAYRSQKTIPKPRVSGVVTGKVVTPAGNDSYLDEYGRVCVQFWWDRARSPNTPDKTLLRVAQQWAGKGWGTYFWPRVGDEVLIDFVEGDPDAPIVVGSLYNGVNMPKYDPRSEYTRSGILTRSSNGGTSTNANEFRLEDKKGAEQVFLNAERDMDHRIEHDSRRWVGHQDSLIVQGDQREHIAGGRDGTIARDHNETIGGNWGVQVSDRIVIQAGMQIALQVGETFLTLGPEGIALSGPLVRINSGGAPGDSLGHPVAPDISDDGTRGGKM